MTKTIIIMGLLSIFILQGCGGTSDAVDQLKESVSNVGDNISDGAEDIRDHFGEGIISEDDEENTTPTSGTHVISNYINPSNCDQDVELDLPASSGNISICFDYGFKSPTFVGYVLDGEKVYVGNIAERPDFYSEPQIPADYRTVYADMSGSGYDRGHLASDASFDYNQADLEMTYSMVNIIPQDPNVNRYMWVDAENYSREKAAELGSLNVVNGVVFSSSPERIGDDVAVPHGFYKILWNEDKNFLECYYYDNFVLGDMDADTLAKHKVDCAQYIR